MKKIKTIKDYREIQFNALCYINHMSEKLGVNCFLSGGTLLGAIRHKGFIPWDDDIDVMLLRKDYDKLIKAIMSDNSSPYRVLTIKNDSQYYYPFAKVVDSRTKLIENVKVPIDNLGIYVDLFPIDAVPNTESGRERYFKHISKVRTAFDNLYEIGYGKSDRKLLMMLYRKLLRTIAVIINYCSAFYNESKKNNVAVSVWGYGKKEVIDKKKMLKGIKVEFESDMFLAPVGYDTYLRNLYGDYMKLPPKSKQHSEHNAIAWYRN